MASLNNRALLTMLQADTEACIAAATALANHSTETLRQRPATESWSVVEVLHHLNYYASYYLQAMETAMQDATDTATTQYHPGWLGDYFTKIIGPRDEQGKLPMAMASPPGAVPPAAVDLDPVQELNEYLAHQNHLLQLLDKAQAKDLGRIRIPITLTRFIRLKLGDTFRFVIAHQQRHHQQIEAALQHATNTVV